MAAVEIGIAIGAELEDVARPLSLGRCESSCSVARSAPCRSSSTNTSGVSVATDRERGQGVEQPELALLGLRWWLREVGEEHASRAPSIFICS